MLQLNGTRNYELISKYVSKYIADNIYTVQPVKIWNEYYQDFSESDFPCINVVLNNVTPKHRDAIVTANTCTVSIIVFGEAIGENGMGHGRLNSFESKKTCMNLIGQIDNILSKIPAYHVGSCIGTVSSGSIQFGNKDIYNATGSIFGVMNVEFLITEKNDDLFNDVCKEAGATVQLDKTNQGYFYETKPYENGETNN